MAESPDNLVLTYLRRIDEKVDRLAEDMREVKSRLGILESQYANLSNRLDRLDERVGRPENRPGMHETPRFSPHFQPPPAARFAASSSS